MLKRLGATPLGRPRLLAAKTLAILVVEVVQVAVLWALALALGWDPSPEPAFVLAVILGTAAFAGLGLCLAGTLKPMVALAAANGLYLVLLLLSGMVIPLDELPGPAQAVARALPSGALTEVMRGTLTAGVSVPERAWAVLTRLGRRRPSARHPPLPLGVTSSCRGLRLPGGGGSGGGGTPLADRGLGPRRRSRAGGRPRCRGRGSRALVRRRHQYPGLDVSPWRTVPGGATAAS